MNHSAISSPQGLHVFSCDRSATVLHLCSEDEQLAMGLGWQADKKQVQQDQQVPPGHLALNFNVLPDSPSRLYLLILLEPR